MQQDVITIEFKGSKRGPVAVKPDEAQHFINGEVPPRIADTFLPLGMPKRGLIQYKMTIKSGRTTRVVGPSLCRRAGTSSSAR